MRYEMRENEYGYEIYDNVECGSLHSDDCVVDKLNEQAGDEEAIEEVKKTGQGGKTMKDYSGKKIRIMQEKLVDEFEEVEIRKNTIIPSWCGGCICSICEDDINDDTQIVFSVPYHIEYAHIKCFKEATK